MTKKQLQKQIDGLKESNTSLKRRIERIENLFHIKEESDWVILSGSGIETKTVYAGTKTKSLFIEALEQYLGIEYKVTESKREEGYVKKEDVLFGNNLSGACSVGDYSGNFIKGKEGRIAKPKKEDIAIGFGESEYITKATRPSSDKKKK